MEHILITPAQCRMARSLLNWTQTDLAERCDLAPMTVTKFEKEGSDKRPEARTLEKLRRALESGGVEFLPHEGVCKASNQILVLKGTEGFAAFFDNVYDTAKAEKDPNICVVNVDDKLFLQWHSTHAPEYIRKMSALKIKPVRSLLNKGDDFRVADKYSHYKWIDQAIPSSSTLYLYGNKAAIFNFKPDDVEITVVNNASTTQMLRSMFEVLWEKASDTP